MNEGHFYYIEDRYFIDFPDQYLMRNKETVNGKLMTVLVFTPFKTIKPDYIGWFLFLLKSQNFELIIIKKWVDTENVIR